jgi:hypothetical protein
LKNRLIRLITPISKLQHDKNPGWRQFYPVNQVEGEQMAFLGKKERMII